MEYLNLNHARDWLRAFVPMPIVASKREKFYGCLGALVGLFFAEWICRVSLGGFNIWFIAPMGASAVLLFAVPSSPLAQPWALIGGNLFSALIGVMCARWIDNPGLAAGVAAALAIGAMFTFRCIHPPSGAVALTAVMGGPAIKAMGFHFVLLPVAVNSVALLLVALLFNNLLRRNYPHRAVDHSNRHLTKDLLPSERVGFNHADLEDVLKERGQLLDINQDDLEEILVQAELHAHRRRFGDIRCADIMSRDVVSAQPSTRLDQAWVLLAQHKVKALPVVDEHGELVGIVSLHDFFVNRHGPDALIAAPVRNGALCVKDVMTRHVISARPEQPIVELVSRFSDGGLHHLPVIDAQRHIVGMVTQSDLVAALFRSQLDRPDDDSTVRRRKSAETVF
jgi:CBS domain-containing membrane protein